MRCAVIGDPAEHSLSPAIHRSGYETLGLGWRYDAIPVTPDDLASFVQRCIADRIWAGLSVTAPHKEAIIAFGEPDHVTQLVGAGNTMVFGDRSRGSTPTIHNTDVPGFVRAWRSHNLAAPDTAAVVGNGATARSLLTALAGLGTSRVILSVRNPSRTEKIAELARALDVELHVQSLDAQLPSVALVANTIPAAATVPYAQRWAQAAEVVFDVVYDPWPTPLASAARDAGRMALNGLDLLAGQAVDQFFLMTGGRVTFEDCRRAAATELRSRQSA